MFTVHVCIRTGTESKALVQNGHKKEALNQNILWSGLARVTVVHDSFNGDLDSALDMFTQISIQ